MGKNAKRNRPFSIYSPVWTGLAKMIEEAGEVIQAGCKIMSAGGNRDWNGDDLVARLQDELGDLMATMDFLIESNVELDQTAIRDRRTYKIAKFREHGWPNTDKSR